MGGPCKWLLRCRSRAAPTQPCARPRSLQVHEAFTKFGVIREDETGQPRIKLYRWVWEVGGFKTANQPCLPMVAPASTPCQHLQLLLG